MNGTGGIVIIVIILIALVVWIEWIIGKAIGKHVSKGTGLILGLLGIFCGLSIIAGIACIVYSQPNKEAINVNANVTTHEQQNVSISNGDTRDCPFCAELIKKKATVCRFCGKKVPPIA
jgi:hypothetical protein